MRHDGAKAPNPVDGNRNEAGSNDVANDIEMSCADFVLT